MMKIKRSRGRGRERERGNEEGGRQIDLEAFEDRICQHRLQSIHMNPLEAKGLDDDCVIGSNI